MKRNYLTPVLRREDVPNDDSKLIEEQMLNLDDGRPVIAQLWVESGYTFLTYYFTSEYIDNLLSHDILDYIKSNGIFISERHVNSNPSVELFKDLNNVDCWRTTIVISESED